MVWWLKISPSDCGEALITRWSPKKRVLAAFQLIPVQCLNDLDQELTYAKNFSGVVVVIGNAAV